MKSLSGHTSYGVPRIDLLAATWNFGSKLRPQCWLPGAVAVQELARLPQMAGGWILAHKRDPNKNLKSRTRRVVSQSSVELEELEE